MSDFHINPFCVPMPTYLAPKKCLIPLLAASVICLLVGLLTSVIYGL